MLISMGRCLSGWSTGPHGAAFSARPKNSAVNLRLPSEKTPGTLGKCSLFVSHLTNLPAQAKKETTHYAIELDKSRRPTVLAKSSPFKHAPPDALTRPKTGVDYLTSRVCTCRKMPALNKFPAPIRSIPVQFSGASFGSHHVGVKSPLPRAHPDWTSTSSRCRLVLKSWGLAQFLVPNPVRLQDFTARCLIVRDFAPKAPRIRRCLDHSRFEANKPHCPGSVSFSLNLDGKARSWNRVCDRGRQNPLCSHMTGSENWRCQASQGADLTLRRE